jgi:hypothetical protein
MGMPLLVVGVVVVDRRFSGVVLLLLVLECVQQY